MGRASSARPRWTGSTGCPREPRPGSRSGSSSPRSLPVIANAFPPCSKRPEARGAPRQEERRDRPPRIHVHGAGRARDRHVPPTAFLVEREGQNGGEVIVAPEA